MMRISGPYAQKSTSQNTGQYGQTKGSGLDT
jgi:hypothetical protein